MGNEILVIIQTSRGKSANVHFIEHCKCLLDWNIYVYCTVSVTVVD